MQNLIASSTPGPFVNLTEYVVSPGENEGAIVSKKAKSKKGRKRSKEDDGN